MKIANIDREILHIFWTTWGTSMKFSEKMWLMVILKVRKNQPFSLSLEDTFFEKPEGEKGGGGLNWPPAAVLGLMVRWFLMKPIMHLCLKDLESVEIDIYWT